MAELPAGNINLAEFETAFRELKNELYMKRAEVSKLKSELEEAHNDNHSLKEALDKLKKESEGHKITMEMFMQKTKDFEPKYYEKRDALMKLELQYKIETSKNNALREDNQKLAIDKLQLIRKLDVLEEKSKRDSLYSNDITQKMGELKNTIGIIRNDIHKAKEEQCQLVTLSQQVDLAQESLQKCQELCNCIDVLKQEKNNLEEHAVKYKAKSEVLESFITANESIFSEENLEARVILTQLQKMSAHYKQQTDIKNEIITSLNDNMCRERVTNMKLIEEAEHHRKQINELRSKLEVYEPAERGQEQEQTIDVSIVEVKNEIIAIDDSM